VRQAVAVLRDFRIVVPWVTIIVLLVVGLVFAWPSVYAGITTGDRSFLLALLAEGIAILISALVIAPLTEYYVSQRRHLQLQPVRHQLLTDIAAKLERICDQFLTKTALTAMDQWSVLMGDLDRDGHRYTDPYTPVTSRLEVRIRQLWLS